MHGIHSVVTRRSLSVYLEQASKPMGLTQYTSFSGLDAVLQQPLAIPLFGALVILFLAVLGFQYVSGSSKYKFPPSPPGRLPIVGHAHLMPKDFPGEKTKAWGKWIEVCSSARY